MRYSATAKICLNCKHSKGDHRPGGRKVHFESDPDRDGNRLLIKCECCSKGVKAFEWDVAYVPPESETARKLRERHERQERRSKTCSFEFFGAEIKSFEFLDTKLKDRHLAKIQIDGWTSKVEDLTELVGPIAWCKIVIGTKEKNSESSD